MNQLHSVNLSVLVENSTTVINMFLHGRLDFRVSHCRSAGEGTNVKDKKTYSLETNGPIVFRKTNVCWFHATIKFIKTSKHFTDPLFSHTSTLPFCCYFASFSTLFHAFPC